MRTVMMLFLLVVAVAQAEINIGKSLPVLTWHAPHIALMKHSQGYLLRVETLKGNPPQRVQSKPSHHGRALVFFTKDGTIDTIIHLQHPVAFDIHTNLIQDEDEILRVVRARLRKPPVKASFLMEVEPNSPAWNHLWAGSACFVEVPADPELEAGLLETTQHRATWTRARAAYRLGYYKTDASIKRLHQLLNDMGTDEYDGATIYPVRQAAYLALSRLGQAVKQPSGYRAKFSETILKF